LSLWPHRTGAFTAIAFLAGAAVVVLSAVVWEERSVALYFVIWLCGVGAWFWHAPRQPLLALTLFLGTMLLSRTGWFDGNLFLVRDGAIGLSLLLLLGAVASRWPAGATCSAAIRTPGVWLAGISFSLYLTHMPTIRIFTLASKQSGWVSFPISLGSLGSYILFVAGATACIGVGWLFWWLFERHTHAVRTLMRRVADAMVHRAAKAVE
jgi:peptidoglycan/LPS O-acetylase OafA/YrhL